MSWIHILLFTCALKIHVSLFIQFSGSTFECPTKYNTTIHERYVQNAIAGRKMRLMMPPEIYV